MAKKITLCACSSRSFIDKEVIIRFASVASLNGFDVKIVADLCEMAADNGDEVREMAKGIVVGCHERALKSVIEFTGVEPELILNARSNDADSLLEKIEEFKNSNKQGVETENTIDAAELEKKLEEYREIIDNMPRKHGKDAWYPVIDKDVCAECSKCLDYCPFGVYEMVNERVRVMHPHNCKNNCPACARICPANAVIFPKYDNSPINGGEATEESAVQLDTKTLYAKAFKERLEARKKKRSL